MILIGITISIVIIGILCIIKGHSCGYWDGDNWMITGIFILLFGGMFLIAEIGLLIAKPFDYKTFKVKYDTIKETMTSKEDVRDAAFTSQLIEINQKIRSCNEFKNSNWIGIFQNEKICELELLNKLNESKGE